MIDFSLLIENKKKENKKKENKKNLPHQRSIGNKIIHGLSTAAVGLGLDVVFQKLFVILTILGIILVINKNIGEEKLNEIVLIGVCLLLLGIPLATSYGII